MESEEVRRVTGTATVRGSDRNNDMRDRGSDSQGRRTEDEGRKSRSDREMNEHVGYGKPKATLEEITQRPTGRIK